MASRRSGPNGWPIGQSMPKLRTEAPIGAGISLEDDHAPAPPGELVGMGQPENPRADHGIVVGLLACHGVRPSTIGRQIAHGERHESQDNAAGPDRRQRPRD